MTVSASTAGAASSQWLFPLSALHVTPSHTTSAIPLERELYDRSRGVEFLFRLGVSLGLPSSAMYTAATWFHRFYMRYSMEDYHRQDVAAACIFLATKTEECGRKLRDVAKIACAKARKVDPKEIADDSREVEEAQTNILLTEEVLLEALCFDFVVDPPQAELVDLLDAREQPADLEDYAWSIANDSYRTPLCLLFPPNIIATTCFVLAQHLVEGPNPLTPLSARISSPAPSASLPTPPSQNMVASDNARFAIEFFRFNEMELASVGEALGILLEFYAAQDIHASADYLSPIAEISAPNGIRKDQMYRPFVQFMQPSGQSQVNTALDTRVPFESDGNSPSKPPGGWKPISDNPPVHRA
ncbi:cyclin-like protein [Panus rudis PR-1116 ss-1]|nr:cyclin-like protein [Panus rudis PR-1116 ss-1]